MNISFEQTLEDYFNSCNSVNNKKRKLNYKEIIATNAIDTNEYYQYFLDWGEETAFFVEIYNYDGDVMIAAGFDGPLIQSSVKEFLCKQEEYWYRLKISFNVLDDSYEEKIENNITTIIRTIKKMKIVNITLDSLESYREKINKD